MTFSYQRITSQISRPILPIILRSNTKFVAYWGLVDSGSDYCVFDQEIAETLGVRLSKEEKVNIKGVSGKSIEGKFGILVLKIGDKNYKVKAVFAKIGKFNHGILGTKGFFDQFDVKLSYRKRTIEVNRSPQVN